MREVGVEVAPVGVVALDQAQLRLARSGLDLLFARDGFVHALVIFIPDEERAAVSLREAGCARLLVLVDAAREVGRHARVERPVALAGHDVDGGRFHAGSVAL